LSLRDVLTAIRRRNSPQTVPERPDGAEGKPLEEGEIPRGYMEAQLFALRQSWEEFFSYPRDRQARYDDYSKMDYGDITAMLDCVVDACLISDDGQQRSFRVEPRGNKIGRVVDGTLSATSLKGWAGYFLRESLKWGDVFIEPLVDDHHNIVGLQDYPPGYMFVNKDKKNQFIKGKAYQQISMAGKVIASWTPDEMIHLKWRPDKKLKYSGGSMLDPLRRDWRRLQQMEDSLAVARMVRAYLRYVHYLDATGKSTTEAEEMLKNYRKQLTRAKTPSGAYRKAPLEVDSDLFISTGYLSTPSGEVVPSLTHIQEIDPRNAGLAEIGDVEHVRRKLFNRVPAEIVGIDRKERDITQQDVAFSRFIQHCQYEVLGRRLIEPILDKALMLKGYAPEGAYKLVFPDATVRMSWRFADAFFRTSMGYTYYRDMGLLSNKWIAKRVFNMSDEDYEAVRADAKGDPPIDPSSKAQQARAGQKST